MMAAGRPCAMEESRPSEPCVTLRSNASAVDTGRERERADNRGMWIERERPAYQRDRGQQPQHGMASSTNQAAGARHGVVDGRKQRVARVGEGEVKARVVNASSGARVTQARPRVAAEEDAASVEGWRQRQRLIGTARVDDNHLLARTPVPRAICELVVCDGYYEEGTGQAPEKTHGNKRKKIRDFQFSSITRFSLTSNGSSGVGI